MFMVADALHRVDRFWAPRLIALPPETSPAQTLPPPSKTQGENILDECNPLQLPMPIGFLCLR